MKGKLKENIIIALAKRGIFHPLSKKEMEEAADKCLIKTANTDLPVNVIKMALTNPDYLILNISTQSETVLDLLWLHC